MGKLKQRSMYVSALLLVAAMFPIGVSAASCGQSIAPSPAVATQIIKQAYADWQHEYVTANGADGQLRVQRSAGDKYDTVSEGIGYGMLFAAVNNDRSTFDKLWNYEQAHLDANGLMNWRIANDGYTIGTNAATDADEDMAFALVTADKTWGGYSTAATNQIKLIKQYEIEPGTQVVKPGDVWGGSNQLDPSYLAPGYYSVFADYMGDTTWDGVSATSYNIFQAIRTNTLAKSTGLIPDWSTAQGQPVGGMSYQYSYDASRAPIRLAMANSWTCSDDAANALAPLNATFQSIGITKLVAGYSLNGSPTDTNGANTPAIAAAAAAATASGSSGYRNSAWKALVTEPLSTYFPDSLRLLGLLVASGSLANPLQPITVTNVPKTSQPAAQTSASTPAKLDIWWPKSGSIVNGDQPFKAMLEGPNVQSYSMYWRVDNGQLNPMDSNDEDYPHKQANVSLTGWNWHGDGPYTVTFIAKDTNGVTISSASTSITVK